MKKIQNLITRNKSVVTNKDNLQPLFKLDDFPVFFGCVDTPTEDDLVATMEWCIDPETGVIQLTKLIPLEVLYQEQHVDGTGKIWEEYYSDFTDYIIKNNPKNVLEIGGGIGVIAELATSRDVQINWTIVEPNPMREKSEKIDVIPKFFDENFKSEKKYDAVVFSQVMEHVYNPRVFIKSISNFLEPGEKLIFAYPNLKIWLENKYTNALNFEHTMFLTDYHVDYLLSLYNFKISDKYFYKDHSVFYVVEKTKNTVPTFELDNKYNEYKKIFLDFVNYHKVLVDDLNQKIDSTNEPVYLFGAHIFSSFLFAFGLKTEKILSILDNSKLKNKRRLYGTNFIIDYPEILRDKGKVNLILKAGLYNDEIKKQIISINNEVSFW